MCIQVCVSECVQVCVIRVIWQHIWSWRRGFHQEELVPASPCLSWVPLSSKLPQHGPFLTSSIFCLGTVYQEAVQNAPGLQMGWRGPDYKMVPSLPSLKCAFPLNCVQQTRPQCESGHVCWPPGPHLGQCTGVGLGLPPFLASCTGRYC